MKTTEERAPLGELVRAIAERWAVDSPDSNSELCHQGSSSDSQSGAVEESGERSKLAKEQAPAARLSPMAFEDLAALMTTVDDVMPSLLEFTGDDEHAVAALQHHGESMHSLFLRLEDRPALLAHLKEIEVATSLPKRQALANKLAKAKRAYLEQHPYEPGSSRWLAEVPEAPSVRGLLITARDGRVVVLNAPPSTKVTNALSTDGALAACLGRAAMMGAVSILILDDGTPPPTAGGESSSNEAVARLRATLKRVGPVLELLAARNMADAHATAAAPPAAPSPVSASYHDGDRAPGLLGAVDAMLVDVDGAADESATSRHTQETALQAVRTPAAGVTAPTQDTLPLSSPPALLPGGRRIARIPLSRRQPQAVWRGGRAGEAAEAEAEVGAAAEFGQLRHRLVRFCGQRPDLFDVGFVGESHRLTRRQQADRYRIRLLVDDELRRTFDAAWVWALGSGCVLIVVGEWLPPLAELQPWVHYIPARADLSDLDARVGWALSHPESSEAIARRASALHVELHARGRTARLLGPTLAGMMAAAARQQRPADEAISVDEAGARGRMAVGDHKEEQVAATAAAAEEVAASPYPIDAGRLFIMQDGMRDISTHGAFRADESGGWVWEASRALDAACDTYVREALGGRWEGLRVLELGAGTGWLSLHLARRGAIATATDREGALPRIVRNILRNQQRTGTTADGEEPLLRVESVALDWEVALPAAADDDDANERDGLPPPPPPPPPLPGPFDMIVGGDLIYMHEMHAPLLATIVRLCTSQAADATGGGRRVPHVLLSWEQRKPREEASFLRMAAAAGFECTLVHETTSTVNIGAPITVHALAYTGTARHLDASPTM